MSNNTTFKVAYSQESPASRETADDVDVLSPDELRDRIEILEGRLRTTAEVLELALGRYIDISSTTYAALDLATQSTARPVPEKLRNATNRAWLRVHVEQPKRNTDLVPRTKLLAAEAECDALRQQFEGLGDAAFAFAKRPDAESLADAQESLAAGLIDKLRRRVEELERERDKAQESLAVALSLLDDIAGAVGYGHFHSGSLLGHRTGYRAGLVDAVRALDSVPSIEELRNELVIDADDERDAYKSAMDEAKAECEELRGKLSDLETELTAVRGSRAEWRARYGQDVSDLRSERDKLQQRVLELSTAIDEATDAMHGTGDLVGDCRRLREACDEPFIVDEPELRRRIEELEQKLEVAVARGDAHRDWRMAVTRAAGLTGAANPQEVCGRLFAQRLIAETESTQQFFVEFSDELVKWAEERQAARRAEESS